MSILLTTAGRNGLLNSGKAAFTHASAMADIGTTEATGVTRQAITWGAAASGVATNSAALTIPVGAGGTVVGVGLYDALTVGNLLGIALQGSTTPPYGFLTATATTDLFASNVAHGVTTDNRVAFVAVANGSLPAGVSGTTLYFVLAAGLTTTAFKVSTTSAGTALDVTADGNTLFGMTTPQVFSLAGNLTIAIGALSLDLRAV